eukprot:CAMPEP_0119295776 /NCGR_PEP_ID=MMETSP1329-20130426/50232_1 /TAXON_ID=114041 /ORGANISM="Genus nov. species nov., Strain RCC1024" /LENGTH=70 /DNA_ID=CAMNT_0007296695 /DNA_START=464 /DNA_END=676 /DNA_ORIENTATION=-
MTSGTPGGPSRVSEPRRGRRPTRTAAWTACRVRAWARGASIKCAADANRQGAVTRAQASGKSCPLDMSCV